MSSREDRIVSIANEICRRDTETTEQVKSNRMKLIYGLLWTDKATYGTSAVVWKLMKTFLSHEEKGQGITLARNLIEKMREP